MAQTARRGSVKGTSGASVASKQIGDRAPLGPSNVLNSLDNAMHTMMEDDAVMMSDVSSQARLGCIDSAVTPRSIIN